MANNYYTFDPQFVPGQKVRSDDMNLQLGNVETGFDALPADTAAVTRGTTYLGVESGSGNSYVVTLPDVRTQYLEGDKISFRATHVNTGATSINIDGIGLIPLVRADESPSLSGDFVVGAFYEAIYHLTENHFQLLTPNANVIGEGDLRVTWATEWAKNAIDVLVSTDAGGNGTTDYSALHWADGASQAWAINAEDSAIGVTFGGDGATTFSALHWAAKSSTSASNSSSSATSSLISALAAADEKTYAEEWAQKAEDSPVSIAAGGDGSTEFSALHWSAKAAGWAASVNLPAIVGGDADKQLKVNAGETGYELYDILSQTNNWTGSQEFDNGLTEFNESLVRIRHDTDAATVTFLSFNDIDADGGAFRMGFGMIAGTHDIYIKRSDNVDVLRMAQNALLLETNSTQLLFNSIDVQRAATATTTGLVERATDAEVVTGTDTTRYVAPLEIATNFYPRLTGAALKINNTAYFNSVQDDGNSGTVKTIDWTTGNKHKVILTGNCTFTFTAPAGPTNLTLRLDNDTITTRTATWASNIDWAGGIEPIFNTGSSDQHIVSFYWDGTTYYGAYGLNFF